MATGQYWSPDAEGGYLYHDELSKKFRRQLQPRAKFRQFADATDADGKELHRGDRFYWNIGGDIALDGTTEIGERQPIPEGDFEITQSSLQIKQMGFSVPYSFKLEALAAQPIVEIATRQLMDHARKWFDAEVYTQFDTCALRVTPTGGTSLTALTTDTDGTASVTNNIAMAKEHISLLEVTMSERNIPPFTVNDYVCLSRPTTLEPVRQDLEAIKLYTETGMGQVFEGEMGRYSGVRFVKQTNMPEGGAEDSTTFNPYTVTGDAWNNAKSSWAFFFGADTVMECLVIPEEIRAAIPSNFGLAKAIAWYVMGGYGLVRTDATNGTIIKWDSAT